MRRRIGRDELLKQQVQRVVQDVFRSEPTNIAMLIYQERDLWD